MISVPVTGRSAPAHGKDSVHNAGDARFGAVSKRRKVGNHADKPEDERNRRIGADGKNIPDQWAAELRPQPHGVGIGQQPEKFPWPAQVKQRKHSSAGDGKEGHRFSEAIDAGAPVLPHQEEHGANESSGVTNADPPDKIDDGESPRDWNIDAPDAHAAQKQIGDRRRENQDEQSGQRKTKSPCPARLSLENDVADFIRNGFVVVTRGQNV